MTWSYDPTYQLTNEQRSGANSYNITYVYDPLGNRTLLVNNGSPTTYTYNAANEMATSQTIGGTTTYTFDGDGNLLTTLAPGNQRTTNTWDGENRLTQSALPSGITDIFTYNADGQRVQKQDSTGVTKHVWEGQKILLETSASNAVQAVYTSEPGPYGNLISQSRAGVATWYLFNDQGSASQLASSIGVVTDAYAYSSFGTLLLVNGTTTNPFRFVGRTGYYYDVDTTALYLRARLYAPSVGRFISRDPLAVEAPSASTCVACGDLYIYVGNNPVNGVDPSGLQVFDPCAVENALKNAFYKLVRNNVFPGDNVWGPLLDDWYNEAGTDPRSFDGLDDPHNKQISQNLGFKKLLQCWFAFHRRGAAALPPPPNRWSVTPGGFTWEYTLNPFEAAGGPLAFNPVTNFMGGYTATVTMLQDDCPLCDVRIQISNVTSWFSATRIPGRWQKFLASLGLTSANGKSVWPSHLRGRGPCKPSTGGNFTQIYTFDLKGVECVGNTCNP